MVPYDLGTKIVLSIFIWELRLVYKKNHNLILFWGLMDGSLFHLSIINYAVAVVSSAELLWYIGEKCLTPENDCPEASGCPKMLDAVFPLKYCT